MISHPCKAVGLLSGGLDSALASALLKSLGLEVHAVFIEMPWGCGKHRRVEKITQSLGIPLKVISLGDDYLDVLKNPKHGIGSAFNPCIDCHIYMVRKAAEYMKEIGAAFVFTGEVLGQRPMSQRRAGLDFVEKDAGLPGLLLRPLSAQLLEPTIPEKEGIVDRTKLLGISGRSRKVQYELADKFGLEHFAQPAGGCLLTEKVFGERLKDALSHGCDTIEATTVIGLGRYFRIRPETFVILGRDNEENETLVTTAMKEDMLLRPVQFPGPAALVRGKSISDGDLALAAGLIQYFSKLKNEPGLPVTCWMKSAPENIREIVAVVPDEGMVKKFGYGGAGTAN